MNHLLKFMAGAAGNSDLNVAWDLDYAEIETDESQRWDISTAVFTQNFSVASQDTVPEAIRWKPDGTSFYVLGSANDSVYQYDLTDAWALHTASYANSFSVTAYETSPGGLDFKPDGTKMYVCGYTGDALNEFDLSTAWDISTASYIQNFSLSAQEASPMGVTFKTDGTKMYIVGTTGDDVNEYDLSTAWDISTASYLQNFSVSSQDSIPADIYFKSDGTKMYINGYSNDRVNEYDLSTAWDVTTATFNQYFYVGGAEATPRGMTLKPDGTKLYIAGSSGDDINEYQLAAKSFSVTEDDSPGGIIFKPDGTKMYIIGYAGDKVYEYNLSTAWEITTASFVDDFSVASQETTPTGLFFKPDGTKFYVTGQAGDDINQYDLSNAWSANSATYSTRFSLSATEVSPTGVSFKPDGTVMYIVGLDGDDVGQYSLSTAWDISTASYVQAFSVASQDTLPQDIYMKTDGTMMFIMGADDANDRVFAYNISTAWDISTASFSKSFDTTGEEPTPKGMVFKPDGSKFYIVGNTDDLIYQYSISA